MNESTGRRLAEIAHLKAGWLDGQGEAVDESMVRLAGRYIDELTKAPRIYPTPSGGVQIEWAGGMIALTLDPFKSSEFLLYGEVLRDDEDEA